jgi:hypothetical protein
MQLPDHSIGITDLLAYRECARRMSYGMRRHTGRASQSDRLTPEIEMYGAVWARAYGSAIHEAIAATEDGFSDDDAVQRAWDKYGRLLDPEDVDLLRDDLVIYRRRDFPNTRLIASEDEFRIPLLEHEGQTVYFRFKVDRLYERLDAPGLFLHVDYKSSKWAKSQVEVQGDPQLWAYNLGIHEVFPECDELHQFYDQLRYGQVPTRKTAKQREQMREWLVRNVRTILADEDWQGDDLLSPTFNEWCPWCPVLESCPVVPQLTTWAATRIDSLAPTRKEGRKTIVDVDPARIEEYTAELEKAKRATQVLERFADSVKRLIRQMPPERRAELGYEVRERKASTFTPQAAAALHERLGPRFYEVVKLTKSGLEENLAGDAELLAWALDLADETAGASVVQRRAA